jgi:hypothetical protein
MSQNGLRHTGIKNGQIKSISLQMPKKLQTHLKIKNLSCLCHHQVNIKLQRRNRKSSHWSWINFFDLRFYGKIVILLISYRMNGFITEYTPGTDHAGIATQVNF